MVGLGFEPRAGKWQAQAKPQSYGFLPIFITSFLVYVDVIQVPITSVPKITYRVWLGFETHGYRVEATAEST